MNYKDDLTIIMAYWNVEKQYFTDTMSAVLQHNIPLIIYNDACDAEYREQLFYYQNNPLVTIIDSTENKGQPTATFLALSEVKTTYVIRVDSDDLLLSLPETSAEDFDVLFIKKKIGKNLYRWLEIGGSPNGSVFKTEIFKYMYQDYIFMSENSRWINEDNYAIVRMFLNKEDNNYKIIMSDNINCYSRVIRPLSQASNKCANRVNMRFETCKLTMMRDSRYFIEDFLLFDIAIRGEYKIMVTRGLLSKELINDALELKEQYKKNNTKRTTQKEQQNKEQKCM